MEPDDGQLEDIISRDGLVASYDADSADETVKEHVNTQSQPVCSASRYWERVMNGLHIMSERLYSHLQWEWST